MVKPTVISTFAGCGGSSLGYQMAGFHELLAVEWDQNAVDTFHLNFPDVPIYHGDIAKLTGEECMRLAGIEKGALDVLDGSPPCQGFSTAGKRKFDDPRNSLFKEYARLLNELQPKVFVMENVTGMVKGYMKQAYLTIIKTLRDCGYKAKGEVMNAMYFNVPQSRERVIIIGVREDLGIEPSHPKPQGKPISIKQAIGKDGFIQYRRSYSQGKVSLAKSSFDKPCLTVTKSGLGWKVFYDTKGNFTKKQYQTDDVMPTITKGNDYHLKIGEIQESATLFKIDDLKILASFPSDFKMTGNFNDKWERIGNSVPPNLMKAIAEHIKINILQRMTDAFPGIEIKKVK